MENTGQYLCVPQIVFTNNMQFPTIHALRYKHRANSLNVTQTHNLPDKNRRVSH